MMRRGALRRLLFGDLQWVVLMASEIGCAGSDIGA
jgi:hypothetical protein